MTNQLKRLLAKGRKRAEVWIIIRRYNGFVRAVLVFLAGFFMRPQNDGAWGRIFASLPGKLVGVPIAASMFVGDRSINPFFHFIRSEYSPNIYNQEAFIAYLEQNVTLIKVSFALTTFAFIWLISVINWPYYKMAVYVLSGKRRWGPSLSYFVVRGASGATLVGALLASFPIWLPMLQASVHPDVQKADLLSIGCLALLSFVINRFQKVGDEGISSLIGDSLLKNAAMMMGFLLYVGLLVPFSMNLLFRGILMVYSMFS